MAKGFFFGRNNLAKQVKKMFVGGTDNKAHQIKKMWVGDKNNKARLCYSSGKSYLPYLTFQSTAPLSIGIWAGASLWDGIIEYSTDLSTWDIWNNRDPVETISSDNGTIYMRGTGNTQITGANIWYRWTFKTDGQLKCIGNIENLLDYKTVAKGEHPAMSQESDSCYGFMFANCTSLVQAPELPATTLANECYEGMFYGCTSLTQAPELPTVELTLGCYANMFEGCTSLIQAPELPATTLANACYDKMFESCDKLTEIHLPSSVKGNSCITNFPGDDCTATIYYDL